MAERAGRIALCASLAALAGAAGALWMQLKTREELRVLRADAEAARASLLASGRAQHAAETRAILLEAPEVSYEWSSDFARAISRSAPASKEPAFSGTLTIHNRGSRTLSDIDVIGCFSLTAELAELPDASITGICTLKYQAPMLGAGEHTALAVTAAAAAGGIDLHALVGAVSASQWQDALNQARHSHQVFGPTLSQPGAETYAVPPWGSRSQPPRALYGRIKVAYRLNGVEFQHILTLVTGAIRDADGRVTRLSDRIAKQPVSRIDALSLAPLFVALPQAVDNHDEARGVRP